MNSRPDNNFQGVYIDFGRTAPIVQIPPHPSRNIDPEEYRNFRRARTSFTNVQIAELEREFKIAFYPSRLHRLEISRRLHLVERQVKVWFQNRRSKEKKLCRLVQLFQIHDSHRDLFSEIQPLVAPEIQPQPEEQYREFSLQIIANTNPNVMPTITSNSVQVDLPQQEQHQEEQNNDQEIDIDIGDFLVFRNPKPKTTIYDYDLLNCSFDQYISDSLNLDVKPTEVVDICNLHPTLVLPAGVDIS